MFLPMNDKQFGFWKMRRSGMSNVSIANLHRDNKAGSFTGAPRYGREDRGLAEGDGPGKPDPGREDRCGAGCPVRKSIPFQTNAYIFVSEKHGMQVWYEHDGDCISCDEFTKCIEFIWDFAAELGIKLEKTQDPTKMAEELLAKIREDQG